MGIQLENVSVSDFIIVSASWNVLTPAWMVVPNAHPGCVGPLSHVQVGCNTLHKL